MKVKEDEMSWVLKQGKKKGLKELAEADIEYSGEEDEGEVVEEGQYTKK